MFELTTQKEHVLSEVIRSPEVALVSECLSFLIFQGRAMAPSQRMFPLDRFLIFGILLLWGKER